jgi:hypothetical protein
MDLTARGVNDVRSEYLGLMVASDIHCHLQRPPTLAVTLDQPVRHDANGLMDQFVAPFTLAHCGDRIGPNSPGSVQSNADVQALPSIYQSDLLHAGKVKVAAQVTKLTARVVVEISIVGSGWHGGKVPFQSQM